MWERPGFTMTGRQEEESFCGAAVSVFFPLACWLRGPAASEWRKEEDRQELLFTDSLRVPLTQAREEQRVGEQRLPKRASQALRGVYYLFHTPHMLRH